MLSKQLPSLTSRKAKAPAPASRPVLTQPPTVRVLPTWMRQAYTFVRVSCLHHMKWQLLVGSCGV
jgi:hypothetical protein